MSDPWLRRVIDKLLRRRKYASFFHWPYKKVMEIGIARTLLEAMDARGDSRFCRLRPALTDPPDCEADDMWGRRVGIEVTELVDQDAVEINQRAENEFGRVYRQWDAPGIIKRLEEILR